MKLRKTPIRKTVIALLCISMLQLIATQTFATIFYISPTGNDATGNGTAVAPWKTLYKATTAVRTAGDIIHVNAGTYTETQSSNLAAGVSLEGDGATSVIQASFSTTYQAIIYASSPEGTNGNQTVSNLNFAGRSLTSWCLQIQGRSNVSVFNCTFTGFAQRGVVWGGRGDNGDGAPGIYATGNKFYNNTMTNCASFDGTYGYGCLNIGGQDGMLIYNNNITTTGTTPGWPIKLWNDGYVKGIKIYNNVLKRPPFPYQYNGIGNYFDFAIELFHQQGIEIYGNTIEGSIDLNWQTKGAYAYAAYIHDNVIGRSTQAAHCETGVWLEFESEYVTIENNTFKNISQPIMFSLRPGSYMNNITIQKNLAYNIGKTDGTKEGTAIGIIVNDNSTNYTANNWFVYNNTFTAITGANSPYFGIQFPGGNSSTNIKISNNILTNFDYYVLSTDYGSHINGLEVKNNSLYNNGMANAVEFSNGNPQNYTNSSNLTTNPNLTANYLPVTGSPVVNTGTYVGLPFSGSAPDRGFAELSAALPVKLIEFSATANNGSNLLQWKTATEINSNFFIVQRSNNGTDFESIGSVKAVGNSNSIQTYTFTDVTPLSHITYYRLISVDMDKSEEYSNLVFVKSGEDDKLDIVAAQITSAKKSLTITITSKLNQKALLNVFDNTGKIILKEPVVLQKGSNFFNKSIQHTAPGIYYVNINTGAAMVTKNILSSY